MKTTIYRLLNVVLLLLVLTSCTSRITKDNFDKVQPGMSMTEVITILGQPDNSTTISIGEVSGTTAIWKNRNGEISVHFFNNRVKVKQFVEGVSTSRVK